MDTTSLTCECSCILCPNFETFCPNNGQFFGVGAATTSPASPCRTLMTIAELYHWWQNTNYFSVFLIESAQHVMLILWIGLQIYRMFCLEMAIGPPALTPLE